MRSFIKALPLAFPLAIAGCGGGGDSRLLPNQAPVLSAPASLVVMANGSADIQMQISDDFTQAGQLAVSVSSDQPELLPDSGLTLSGANENRTLSVIPTEDEAGSASIRVVVSDSSGLETWQDVLLDVQPLQRSLEGFVREQFERDAQDSPALVNAVVFEDDVFEDELDDLI